jgi:hypothetical protein
VPLLHRGRDATLSGTIPVSRVDVVMADRLPSQDPAGAKSQRRSPSTSDPCWLSVAATMSMSARLACKARSTRVGRSRWSRSPGCRRHARTLVHRPAHATAGHPRQPAPRRVSTTSPRRSPGRRGHWSRGQRGTGRPSHGSGTALPPDAVQPTPPLGALSGQGRSGRRWPCRARVTRR